MNHPKVIKITNPETKGLVANLAKEDNDNMQMPTHAIVKGDEIVGGWNLCEVPMVLLWHHSPESRCKGLNYAQSNTRKYAIRKRS